MDTSSFIVKRNALRDHMENERVRLLPVANAAKSTGVGALVSVGMKWGLLPMVQEWALAGIGHWVYDKIRGIKSRR